MPSRRFCFLDALVQWNSQIWNFGESSSEKSEDQGSLLLWYLEATFQALTNATEMNLFTVSQLLVGEGNGNPLQYSCLENPVDRGAWWAAVHGVTHSWTWLMRLSMPACIGEGNGSPLQYSCLENPRDRGAWWTPAVYGVTVRHDWSNLAAVAAIVGSL